jgi:hypothetical protein
MQEPITELDDITMQALAKMAHAVIADSGGKSGAELLKMLIPELAKPRTATENAAIEAHAMRLLTAMSMHGIWRHKPDIIKDVANYQQEIRAEWQ